MVGRVGRRERRMRQGLAPVWAEIDEIVAIGAEAVEDDDELLRGAWVAWAPPWSVEVWHMTIVTRFAPSPTGYLHLGHAFSALTARAKGEKFLLRLEDIDTGRCRPEFAEAILEDLAWLGIGWDGEVRAQSAHFAEYQAGLGLLRDRRLLYPCFCTRSDIAAASASAPHSPDGGPVYPGTCRGHPQPLDRPHVWRLDMARAMEVGPLSYFEEGVGEIACDPSAFGDVVLARKDVPASYHLCVTHDDALQGVNLVTRGVDLQPSTHLHRLLQALMGWPAPRYAHHRLVVGEDGRKLSKRDRAETIRSLRIQGMSPQDCVIASGFCARDERSEPE
jgi:glutamyl-Q tRNA(Asp) synthetase